MVEQRGKNAERPVSSGQIDRGKLYNVARQMAVTVGPTLPSSCLTGEPEGLLATDSVFTGNCMSVFTSL
ncbi:hypothetical protein J6590_049096 [Homalodisca vitripennis]|nr:hypothetical protein J6590_049096 [Homalodisca vitripennis]